MNVALPAWMRREPIAPELPMDLPRETADMPEEVKEWAAKQIRRREEMAYLRSENETLDRELKLANEQVRRLEHELNFLRDQYDRVTRHDSNMLGGLGAIKAAINDLEERSRAEAYAPPATGTGDGPERPMDAADEIGLQGIAKALAPEQGNA